MNLHQKAKRVLEMLEVSLELGWTCNKTLDKFLSNILQLLIIIVKRGKIA